MKEYNFIISEKKFTINSEKDLELLFKLFYSNDKVSSVICWNILMEVDQDLEQIITSYKGLLGCLKYLNEKNSFLLLVKLGDILGNLIKSSEDLAEILSRIPNEANKLRLLSILRIKGLTKIMHTAKDLGNILEWLYGKSQRDFIDLLGKDLIIKLFSSTNEIIMVLHFLKENNKDYLMDIVGLDKTIKKIKTSENLLVVFKGLSLKYSNKLLKRYSKKDILSMFTSEENFYNFMIRLPKSKEKIFLNYLKK